MQIKSFFVLFIFMSKSLLKKLSFIHSITFISVFGFTSDISVSSGSPFKILSRYFNSIYPLVASFIKFLSDFEYSESILVSLISFYKSIVMCKISIIFFFMLIITIQFSFCLFLMFLSLLYSSSDFFLFGSSQSLYANSSSAE